VVVPEQEAVLAITAGVSNMQSVLDLVWEHLLPALGSRSLPTDPAAHQALEQRLTALRIDPPVGQPASPRAADCLGRTFALDENPDGIQTLRLDAAEAGCTLVVGNARGEQRIACGAGRWIRGEAAVVSEASLRPAGRAAPLAA